MEGETAQKYSLRRWTLRGIIILHAAMSRMERLMIAACADMAQIPADASDICYVEISMVDTDGNLNPGTEKVKSKSCEMFSTCCVNALE